MKKYINPPNRSEFEFFTKFSNFQIVALCKLELLRNDNKFRRNDGPNPQQLLNDFINNWKEKEFTEFSFRERGSFQLDLQKIIPFKWKSFGDMADKNHLPTFEDQLTNEELRKLDELLSDLEKKWSKDYREFKSISILTDEEMIVRWNDDIEKYEEIK